MVLRATRFAPAALLVVLLVGCGDDADRSATATQTPSGTSATEVPADIERFLLQPDEVPDLTPVGSPMTDTGPPPGLPADGAEVLESSGYIQTVYQPAQGDRGAGVSSVMLFDSEAGAQAWMAYETSAEVIHHQIPDTTIERFEVPGVPGAHGWTGSDLHGNAIGHLFWTQGRCMMLLGLEVEGPRVERLSAGAVAVYERTGGTCPD